jgi:hypothetical protein
LKKERQKNRKDPKKDDLSGREPWFASLNPLEHLLTFNPTFNLGTLVQQIDINVSTKFD